MTTTIPALPPRFAFDLQLARYCDWPCVDETGFAIDQKLYHITGDPKDWRVLWIDLAAGVCTSTIDGTIDSIFLSANLQDPAVQRAVERASRELGVKMWNAEHGWRDQSPYCFNSWDQTIYLPTKLLAQLPTPARKTPGTVSDDGEGGRMKPISQMTDKEKRVAIDAATGNKPYLSCELHGEYGPLTVSDYLLVRGCCRWCGGDLSIIGFKNYLIDLNAMHEAEATLPRTKVADYEHQLNRRHFKDDSDDKWAPRAISTCVFHATAAQRADAFLAALGHPL